MPLSAYYFLLWFNATVQYINFLVCPDPADVELLREIFEKLTEEKREYEEEQEERINAIDVRNFFKKVFINIVFVKFRFWIFWIFVNKMALCAATRVRIFFAERTIKSFFRFPGSVLLGRTR